MTMRFGDVLFLELARDNLLDLVLQSQRYYGNVFGVDWRGRQVVFAARGWQDWHMLVLRMHDW